MDKEVRQQDTAIFMAQILLEYVKQYIEGNDICIASIKEIQSKNDAIMESELLLETIVVENGGEYIIFEYIQMIENNSELELDFESIEILQSMIRKVVFSDFDFVKVWLPKFFYQVPHSYNTGKILQDGFLGELLRNFDSNMMLIFVNICSPKFMEVETSKLLKLIKLIIENNMNKGSSETIANILFTSLRQLSRFLPEIRNELYKDPPMALLESLKLCINTDHEFITTYYLKQISPIVPNINNLTVLRDLIFDLGFSDISLSLSHIFNHTESWFGIREDGLFSVLLDLKESKEMDSHRLRAIDDIILMIIDFTKGRIDVLWNENLKLILPKMLMSSLENKSDLKYMNSIYTTMKITAIMNDCSYKI
ncbi:hypothetical protein C6P41_004143 [Kluyveromyces marxianus]|nr:hypothetical protein C6P43_004707 [Kluyveromyces marxianus]KAG0681768.1 hypothetical protein C6P41_004143 [Kluyveromyces marxianus]